MLTVTPLGRAIGFFPIRDINKFSAFSWRLRTNHAAVAARLPNLAEHFSAYAFSAGLTACHHPFGRGQDVDSHAPQDAGNLAAANVYAAAGAGDALQVRDGRLVVAAVFQ